MLLALRNWLAYLDDPTDVGTHFGTAAGAAICGLDELRQPYAGIPFSSTRVSGGTSGYSLDVGVGQVPVQVLAVIGHNLPLEYKIKFTLRTSNAGSSVVATGIADCINEAAAWPSHWIYILPSPVMAGYIQFDWLGPDTNTTLPEPFVCWRLWASAALQIDAPVPPMGVSDDSLIELGSLGQARMLERSRRRWIEVSSLEAENAVRTNVLGLYDADVSTFEALAYSGRSTEVLAIPRPAFNATTWTEPSLAMIRTAIFGRVVDSPGLVRAAGPLFTQRVRIEEF
ncbi:hypothetical protein C7S18_12125 [Ahniella affigens]|uniref:Uncharacterized protein n=1 Tax=Ahniella affigens TaxID=2021234 RepID=A0A2P1PSR7_9GAMM|nr:hypothetical protein [Ahniella affigens]AVP97898.1 hypothetical protein C7S18_12125 [Ahniella affigens]